jgi:transcriptional regulator with XRE-family HTH domain
METIGQFLRRTREEQRMSVEEVSRSTRVPVLSVERIEADQFDELPVPVDEVLARYTASRRVAWITPLPIASPSKPARGGRFGVAIALVLLLFLFALAVSIVLKPRSDEIPQELSLRCERAQQATG